MDTVAVQMACMADLGRQRQDELPLSNRERKGPSFAPSKRNGTGYIAPALKEGLETKWRVHIEDEESEQMRGLSVQDSRPWAKKITQDFLNLHQRDSAPPCIRQESRGHKRAKRNGSNNIPISSLGGLIPAGGIVKNFTSSKPSTITPSTSNTNRGSQLDGSASSLQKPLSERIASMVSATSIKDSNGAQSSGGSLAASQHVTVNLAIRPKPKQAEDVVVLQGICKLLNPQNRSVLFAVTYAVKLRNDTENGYLCLSAPDKGDKVHNVLDLMAPDRKDDCCRVCSKSTTNGFAYILQFANTSDAHKFKVYLESLQQAAARDAVSEESQNKIDIASAQTTQESTASGTSPSPALNKSASDNSPYTVETPAKQTNHTAAAGTAKLVDIDSPPQIAPEEREFIMEDAAEKLVKLIDQILPEAAKAGILVSDDTVADIEDTAIEDWLDRGFLQCETDDMKADLLNLLRILVRLKRKAESRKRVPPVSNSLQEYDNKPHSDRITYTAPELVNIASSQDARVTNKPDTPRIVYTAAEIKSIAASRAIPQAALDVNLITPRRTSTIRGCSPEAAMADISKHKGWLIGKPYQVATPPESAEKSSNVEAKPMAKLIADAAPQSSSSPGGLGTSR